MFVLMIVAIVIAAIYLVLWTAVACVCTFGEGELNPLSFWRRDARMFWRLAAVHLRLYTIEQRRKREKNCTEIEREIKEVQSKLVELAYKDPKNFLG